MTQSPPKKQPRVPGWVKKVVPAMVSIGILYYYFHDQDWKSLIEACAKAEIWLAIIAIAVPQLIIWFFGTLITERNLRWFHGPFPLWTYFWVRGALYILMLFNTALGGGGIFIYQLRKARISVRKLIGIGLFRGAMIGWGMGFILIPATFAMHYYGLADKIKINMTVWWAILLSGPPGMIATWLFWKRDWDPIGLGKLIVPDRQSEFWTAFRMATTKQWVLTFVIFAPSIIIYWIGFYFLNRAFDVNVPFLEFVVVAPVALMVMDLPVAFAGFGTTTIAWTTFFGDHGTPQNIAALTLFLPFTRAACRSLIGLVSLPSALKEINTLLRPDEPEPGPTEPAVESPERT